MKLKKIGENILLFLIVAVFCFLVADFAVRTINKMHFMALFKTRAEKSSELNQNRIELLHNRFLMDIEQEVIDEKTPLVLFIGDSITLGIPLKKPEHSYPDLLDASIMMGYRGREQRHIRARNISGPGGNIKDEAEIFKSVLEKYDLNTKLLVFGYCLNDIFFSMDENRRGLLGLTREVIENRSLRSKDLKDAHLYYYSKKENQNLVIGAFRDIKQTADDHNTRALVVIFPYFTDFNERSYRYKNIHKQIKEYAENTGLEVLDLLPVYSKYHYSSFMSKKDSTHPNPLGHKFASDAIYKFVALRIPGCLPELKNSPALRVVRDTGMAKTYCETIYDGESRYGISTCYEILESLIKEHKIMGGLNKANKDYFFIDFDIQ